MRIGFMAASKRWAFPIQSPLPSNQSTGQHHPRPTSFRGRETSFESRRLTPHVILDEGELLHRDALKTYACSYPALDTIENTPSNSKRDDSAYLATFTPSNSQFSLVMDHLDKIADIFAGKDSVRLERDILVHVERLGALRLFHASLSRTLMAPTPLNPKCQPPKHSRVLRVDYSCKTVVRTGKKEQRRSRRRRRAASDRPASLNKIHNFEERTGQSSKLKRDVVARSESEMSRGVKELAHLHRTRTELEGQIGRAASYARWAESAGIDEKTLQQRLQFGWYCRDKLIKSTHSLVVYLARNYRGTGIAFDDLLQAGAMGVLKGAERFDCTRGYRFSTYVQYWIRKSILALVARHSRGIQIPVKMQKIIKQIRKARRTFYSREGRYPKGEEVADITGLSLANVRLAIKCSRVMVSLDQEMGGDWCTKFMEVTPDTSIKAPEVVISRQHMNKDISKLLEGLHPKERQVLVLRYGLDDGRCKSLDEVGRQFRVTKEWIRQLQKMALRKLSREDIQREMEYYMHS